MAAQRFESTYQRGLGDCVEDHVGVIQDEHSRSVRQRANDIDLLSDRHRQIVANSPAEHCFIPVRNRLIVVSRPSSCDILRAKSRFSGLNNVRFSMIVPENITGSRSDIGDAWSYRQEVRFRGGDATNLTRPEAGSMSPWISFNSVVRPEPSLPLIPMIVPALIDRSTSKRRERPPHRI